MLDTQPRHFITTDMHSRGIAHYGIYGRREKRGRGYIVVIYTQCAVVETMILVNKSCVKVEVAVLGSPSLTVCTVSVNVKQQ